MSNYPAPDKEYYKRLLERARAGPYLYHFTCMFCGGSQESESGTVPICTQCKQDIGDMIKLKRQLK